MADLREQFGQLDIYLFDQLLRGRLPAGTRVLEAGCGSGRNLTWLLASGYDVYAADADHESIQSVRRLAATLAPRLPAEHFRVEPVEAMTFPDAFVDAVLSIAVLHFARDDAHFTAMLDGTWRVLRTGGLFFCRLASSIGMEGRVHSLAGRRSLLPDGSERYLVDKAFLVDTARRLGGELLDPLKTTVVDDQRSMSTWVMRKAG